MSSKFAPDVPKSLIDAVSSILGEAKVEPAKPDPEAVARKKKLDALRDKQEADKAEKGEDKPQGVRKVAGTAYGGAKQKHEPEIEEELKGNQHKLDKNKNGKLDADDFKKLRGEEVKQIDEYGADFKNNPRPQISTPKPTIPSGPKPAIDKSKLKPISSIKPPKTEEVEIEERTLTSGEAEKKEKYVKSMKKGLAGFKARYGSKAKNVMYATATKLAKNEEVDHIEEAIVNHEDIAKHLIKKHGKDVSMDHIEDAIDGMDDAHKVDKREVLYHVNKLTKEEVEINEGKMKDIYTDMMAHADKKGYSSHKEFTPADYDTVGKQHGISGKELAVLAGHKTAAKVANEDVDSKKKDLPFTPDKPRAPIATPGKYGYGPSAAKHLAKLGMKGLKKEETITEGTGGPIYPKPFVKLGDLIARAKDMRNIKKATIVTPKDENEVVLKKEEAELVDESAGDKLLQAAREYKNGSAGYHKGMIKYHEHMADVHYSDRPKRKEHEENIRHHESELAALKSESYMGKAGCTSEDDKKKAEKPVDYDKPTFLRKKDDWRKSNPAHLPKPTKEEVEPIYEVTYEIKDKFKHSENGHIQLSKQAHTGPDAKDQKWHILHSTFKLDTKNPRRGGDFHDKELHSFSGEDAEKQAKQKFGELKDKHGVKTESVDRIDELSNKLLKKYDAAVDKKHTVREPSDPNNKYSGTSTTTYPNARIATNRIVGAIRSSKRQAGFKGNTDKVSRADHYKAVRKEEVEQLDELSKKTLGLYISKAADPLSKKSNVNLSSRAASKLASGGKDDGSKDDNKAYLRSKGIQNAAKRLSKEDVELDETAVLDKYIRSMGYDPQHLDKNKKVMFAKTNAYKTFASSQKSEALYDGGQKGTQDIDTHMSPGVTARGK